MRLSFAAGVAGVCALLSSTQIATAQTQKTEPDPEPEHRVPAWSAGVGLSTGPFPVAGPAHGYRRPFLTLEPRIARAFVLHAQLGGTIFEQWLDAPESRAQRQLRPGLGARYFIIDDTAVRPSLLALVLADVGRARNEVGDEFSYEQVGAELAAALDAQLSESVALRLETLLVGGGHTVLREGENEQFLWTVFAGTAPRIEMRIGW